MAVSKLRLSLEQLESRLNLSAAPIGINPIAQPAAFDDAALLSPRAAYVAQLLQHKTLSLAQEPLGARDALGATLLAPTGLTVNNATDTTVSLSWTDNSQGESGYYVFRSRDGVTYNKISTLGADARSYTSNYLIAGAKYYFKVAAYDLTNQVASNVVTANTLAASTAPVAPSNLTFSNVTQNSATLSWADNSNNETGFRIYRRTADQATFSIIATLGANATTFSDSGLSPATKYYYRSVAYNSAGQAGTMSPLTTLDATVTPTIAVPAAPSNLSFSNVTTGGLTLGWSDNSSNEDGFRVYRSTDNVNFSVVATLGAGATTFINSGLSSSTTYYYEVQAYNTAGGTISSAASATTLAPAVVTNPVNIWNRNMTSFTELVIDGTSGSDNIRVTQSGSTLIIVANGETRSLSSIYGDIVVRGAAGNDTITIDSSVNIISLIYGGDGSDTLVNRTAAKATIVDIDASSNSMTGNGVSTAFWANPNDVVNASSAEISLGGVNRVSNFYQTSAGAVPRGLYGQNLVDLTDAGSQYRPANNSFWGTGPSMNDINQGQIGDCYFLAPLASLANNQAAKFMNTGVDLGDGTYAVRFTRNGVNTFVRVDGDLSQTYSSRQGASGNLWGGLFEKAYAFFRSGASTYSSLNWGYIGAAFSDLGFANTSLAAASGESVILSTINNALNSGKAVATGSKSSITAGVPIVASHAYSVVKAWRDAAGTVQIQLRNPWGFDGAGNDSNTSDALLTLTYAQFANNFSGLNYTTV